MPRYPEPPAHQTPPAGYPAPQAYAHPAAESQSPASKGWVIGGTAAAGVLAVIAIGFGIYFAASGGSGGQTRLLSAPVVTAAAAASPPGQAVPPASHATNPGPSLPKPQPTPVTHAVVATPAVARTAASESSERRAVANTIERHFALITQHDFSGAYALLAPSLQSGESSWVVSHKQDGIYKVDVSVDATLHSPSSATAAIAKMTTLDGSGCKSWSGSWGLTKIDGQWRISEANVSPSPC